MSERLVLLNTNYSNHKFQNGEIPPNEEPIRRFIQEQKKPEHEEGRTTIILVDTIWKDRFGGFDSDTGENEALANHLGMRAAYFTPIGDRDLNRHEWKQHVGITIATDHDVATLDGQPSVEIVRLGKDTKHEKARNALIMDIELGSRTLTLAALYQPENDAHSQMKQFVALHEKLNGNSNIPRPSGYQIIGGDFNGLDKVSDYHGLIPKIGSGWVRYKAKRAENVENPNYWDETYLALNDRQVIPRALSFGYKDVNAGPTFQGPLPFPILNVDRMLTFGIRKHHVRTGGKGLSDHRAIIFDFTLQ